MNEISRDVSWIVMFRLKNSDIWVIWSAAHRTAAEALRAAEPLVVIPEVRKIRFDRIAQKRERFSLHDLAQLQNALPTEADAEADAELDRRLNTIKEKP